MSIKEYIEQVEERGNVVFLGQGGKITPDVFDDVFKKLNPKAKFEYYLFVEPYLLTRVQEMLNRINATASSYGTFEKKVTALGFVPEVSFTRGSYNVTVFQKSIMGGILIPTYPLSLEDMVRNSVRFRIE